MWQHGEILADMGWKLLVLIPKGNNDTQGVGLLETLWKVVEEIIDTRLRESIILHDILHGLIAGRGTWTAILELKVAQELYSIDQDPLLQFF